MAKVKVHVFGPMKEVIGTGELSIGVKTDFKLSDLIDVLDEKSGGKFKEKIIDSRKKDVSQLIRILINGKDYGLLRGVNTPLNEGDEVLFLPSYGGG